MEEKGRRKINENSRKMKDMYIDNKDLGEGIANREIKFRRATILVRCPLRRGGYTRIEDCEQCDHCVEIHDENEGVFCAYPKVVYVEVKDGEKVYEGAE